MRSTTRFLIMVLCLLAAGVAGAEENRAAPASRTSTPSKQSGDRPEQMLAFQTQNGGIVPAKEDHDFAVSTRSGAGVFEGDVVFVGYGIVDEKHQYNSYRGMPEGFLKGKVVVAFTYEPQNKDGDSLWMPPPPVAALATQIGESPEGLAGRRAMGGEVGPAGKIGKGGVGPWSPASMIGVKAKWAADRGALALLLVDSPAQDVAEPVSVAGARFKDRERDAIPVIHIRSLFFRSLLKRGGGGKNVDTIIEEFEAEANKGNGSLNDETGVEPLRDIRLWGAVLLSEQKK